MVLSLFRKKAENAEDKVLGISRKYVLVPGKSYVVEESPPDVSFDAFTNLVSTLDEKGKKTHGLMLTRQHPDLVRQKYGLESTSIYWLATRAGDGVISPTNLSILTQTMIKFAEGHEDGVILLDGLEYLVSNNDFNKVLRMVDQVNDHISQSGSRLILPVDPRALDRKELALLQRNMERLELLGHKKA
jgi:two-component system cell cycle response regulator